MMISTPQSSEQMPSARYELLVQRSIFAELIADIDASPYRHYQYTYECA